jgi:hydrogenase maturation protein HypF
MHGGVMASACSIRVRGVVQGVGFRPFLYRLAQVNELAGWVLNGEEGVEIHLEGEEPALQSFVRDLESQAPPAARIAEVEVRPAQPLGLNQFTIRESERRGRPTVRISPDLPVCDACLSELFDPDDRRFGYPYINCTNCGPRYTVILGLPYDREKTTMQSWPLDEFCDREYHDPANRRFHAQPVACPSCGPHYFLRQDGNVVRGDDQAIRRAAELLKAGKIVAVKGLGGYHLACDARNLDAVGALRQRKYRKEKPFALMVRDLESARRLVTLPAEAVELLIATGRPIVLAQARVDLPGVAPDNDNLGVMLPYTPAQHLLFAAGAPEILVMTSANRSSEPIAYEDDEALDRLSGIADAFLIGERPIARRVEDSVTRVGTFGPVVLRRARGYSPGAVTTLPVARPILTVGADLKNTVSLAVNGQVFVSQHIGDLDHYPALRAFEETVADLAAMYDVAWDDVLVVHDAHPQYLSTQYALTLPAPEKIPVQHHRAHIASVLAERQAWEKRVLGVSFDGTGYGDDRTIWGGEFFEGSVSGGFTRVAHLRPAPLAGGDAAAKNPLQAAAGFLTQVDRVPNFRAAPFCFPNRYQQAVELIHKGVRTFSTTSMGRLFDTAAALLGFTREITFEAQAAMWLEHVAGKSPVVEAYAFPFVQGELDFRPLLEAVITDCLAGRDAREIARAFQRGVAEGLVSAVKELARKYALDTVVLSGGVFQNEMLMSDLKQLLAAEPLQIWTNHAVPPNDGGISLGQAALAALQLTQPEASSGSKAAE